MNMLKVLSCLATASFFLFAGGPARAIPVGTYDLDILSASSLGTVGASLGSISVNNAGVLQIQLDSGLAFTGPANAPGFGFNLDKVAATAISGSDSGAFVPPPFGGNPEAVSSFGTFSYVIACHSCDAGTTSLTSTEGAPGGVFSSDFTANSDGLYFIADVIGTNGSTAFIGLASAVPEPSTWAMMLLGFCGLGFMASRRNQKGTGAKGHLTL